MRERLSAFRDDLIFEFILFVVFSFASAHYARAFARVFANGVEAEGQTTL